MNIIGLLNLVSFFALLAAVAVMAIRLYRAKGRDASIILIIISFIILLFVTTTNVLEHLNIDTYFDLFEDEIEIVFIPLFIFAIFSYNLKKELAENNMIKKSLERTNLRLNLTMKGANEAVWKWNSKQNELIIDKENCYLNFKPLYYNISGVNTSEIIHSESFEVYNNFVSLLSNNTELPENTEIRIKTSNGEFRWVLLRGLRITDQYASKTSTYLGMLFDISELKKTQNDLLQALEKAEESNRLKTAFLENLSHEIRTPMNGILGFSDLLKNVDLNSDKRIDYIKNIHVSGQRLLSVINDIVEISKIDSGSVEINSSSVEICKMLNELSEELGESLLLNKNIRLFSNCDIKQAFYTTTDEIKIRQVLSNLINNAIKFTRNGTIEIGFHYLESTNSVEFYVKDTGIGIDSKHYTEIFERFRQLKVNYNNLEGLGLGLTIAKSYVEMLGGKIWLTSEVGKGSTFFFTIPNVKADGVKSLIKPAAQQTGQKGELVLVAEDDDSNYFYLQEVLSSQNYQITRACNGIEAVEACKNNSLITLVLMDIKMPEMNGLEATRRIKEFRRNLPIIAQTAYAFPDDEQKIKEAGCDAYIAKPIIKDKLFDLLRNVTIQKRIS